MTRIEHLPTRSGIAHYTLSKWGATEKRPCMQWGIRNSLFCILIVQDFQKFAKSLKPLCRPLWQAFHFGVQLFGFVFLGRQIQAARIFVHAVVCVLFIPDYSFHRRHHSIHLARVGDDFLCGGLRVFCWFFHLYRRQLYLFFLPTQVTVTIAFADMRRSGKQKKATGTTWMQRSWRLRRKPIVRRRCRRGRRPSSPTAARFWRRF